MRPPLDGSTALVTGASSGIGRAFALELAPRVAKIAIVARRRDRLVALAEELRALRPSLEVAVAPCDLSDQAAIDLMLEAVELDLGPIDILINNAGLGHAGLFQATPWPKVDAQIAVNVTALTYLVHRLVPGMVERSGGGVLNVSSGFGLTFFPGMAVYTGTKHFVTAFTESLREELRGTGVVVSQVCPGPVESEFMDVMGDPTGRGVPRAVRISAARCAREALRGFARGRPLIVPGRLMRLILWLGRLTPRFLYRLVMRPVGGEFRRVEG